MEAVNLHTESCSKPFYPYVFTCKCSLQRVVGLVRGLWFLLHYQCWALTGTPIGCPVVALWHGGPAALSQQDQSLHMLQQVTDGMDIGVSQLITLVQGCCKVDRPARSPLSSPPG